MIEAWETLSSERLCDAGIFRVSLERSRGPHGKTGRFSLVDAPDWAAVVPFALVGGEERFVMVRQWRHGSGLATLEFPGGVVEPGEDPGEAALRELAEETGWRAGRLLPAGSVSPNPAFMRNAFHVFVALDLEPTGRVSLDEHEIVETLLVPVAEVRARMGTGEYSHALMAAALLMADRVLGRGPGVA